ncbi:hypothetical protein BGZ97_008397 [Linnemannia gamsii]|uniref:Uncharacterized protein n=1 Tax=Linnemannia gamsii TaxID=64522 RepID=A0A9P6UQL5_9FUNG|nr:hypothetical protein BGZ97_008397 [Linnemannia gamsii]
MVTTLDIIIANSGPDDAIAVPYKHDEPLSFLLKRIHEILRTDQRTVYRQDLFLCGVRLKDHSRTMAYYRIFGNTLTYRAVLAHIQGQGDITIHVKVIGSKAHTLNVSPHSTIDDFKLLLHLLIDLPPNQQTIMFAGKQLKDGRFTLTEHGITNNSTIHLIRHVLHGMAPHGVLFSNVLDKSTIRKHQFAPYATRGCPASLGTSIECACMCTATHKIAYQHGFSILEIAEATFFCPKCGRYDRITPLTVSFMSCKYRFHGIKATTYEQSTSEWTEVKEGDCYQLFDPKMQMSWHRLVIESVSLDHQGECAICLKELRGSPALSCGHQFHATCFGKWKGSCPSCRYNRYLITGHAAAE